MDFFKALIETARLRTKQLDELKISKNGKITAHHLTLALEQFFANNDGAVAIKEEILISRLTDYFSTTAPFRHTIITVPFEVDIPTHHLLNDICNQQGFLLDSFESPLMQSISQKQSDYASQGRHALMGFYADFLEWGDAKQGRYCDEDMIYAYMISKEQNNLLSNLQRKVELRISDIERVLDYINRNSQSEPDINYLSNLYILGSNIRDKNMKYAHKTGLEKVKTILFRNNKPESYDETLKEKNRIIKSLRFKLNNEEYSLFATPASELLSSFRKNYGDEAATEIEILIIPIEELNLNGKTPGLLKKQGVYYLGQLAELSEVSLKCINGMGLKKIEEIKQALKRYELNLNTTLADHVKEFIKTLIPHKKRNNRLIAITELANKHKAS